MEKMESKTSKIEGTSMKRAPSPRPYPWLVYKHGRKDQGQTFCSISESGATEISRRYIPELRNKEIVTCRYGWVVVCDKKGMHYSLWNPVTSESISLPPLNLEYNQYIVDCLLTDSPSHTGSKILLFGGNFHSILCCQLSSSHKQWIEIGYYNQIRNLKQEKKEKYILQMPVSCNGKIYAISSCCPHLLLIELDGSDPDSLKVSLQTKLPKSQHQHYLVVGRYLVESIGEIFVMYLNLGGVKDEEVTCVEVSKLDPSSMTWAKVTSAKDRAFFLGNRYAISCPILSSNIEASRIYFTWGDKSLYSYNMEDQSILVSLPCRDLPTPYNPPCSYWIMPDLNLVEEEPQENDLIINLVKEGPEVKDLILISERDQSIQRKVEDETINLLDLPLLALDVIARHLTLVDYMNFRATSKVCYSIAPPIQWKTEFAGSKKSSLLSPWLIFPENHKGVYQLVDSRLNNKYFLTIPPDSLQDNTVRCSKEGWLLMSNRFSLTLFNPFTKDIIQLPEYANVGIMTFILTCSPSSPDCYIIGITQVHISLDISIICLGENQWREIHMELEKPLPGAYNTAVFCGGAFYFLNQEGMLEVLKIEGEGEISWKSLDEPAAPSTSFHQNYLVECDGELVAIFVGKMGESLEVYKLNFSKLVWEKVTSLKNYALYLSRSSSFSVAVKDPKMANRIYFPRFHNQGILFYSLNTAKFHALGSEDSFMNFYNTKIQLDCGWIEPSWC